MEKENKIFLKDNIGYVEKISISGNEKDISKVAGISHLSEKGPSVKNLLDWNHLSPFEFASVYFKVKAPIFVIRQWFRHRTGHYLEKSLRYCEGKPEFFVPKTSYASLAYTTTYEAAYETYLWLLTNGESKEKARMVLPLATYSEFFFQMDLRNFIHFLDMRYDEHAQDEIREYASMMLTLIEEDFPTVAQYIKEKKSL